QYLDGLRAQMEVAQAILAGLGYEGEHFSLLQVRSASDLDAELKLLARRRGAVPRTRARYAVSAEKRTTLDLALDHLVEQGSVQAEAIALPAGALFGTVHVDKDKCT